MRTDKWSHRLGLPVVGMALACGVLVPSGVSSATSLSHRLPAQSQPLTTISVGYSPEGPYTGDNTIAVANYLGLWQKAGLKLSPQPFTVAPVVEVTALESNHVDVMFGGPGSVHLAMLGNARILGVADFSEEDFLIADSSIQSISQLKGKSVIYDSGTTGEMILDLALHSVGMNLTDIKGIDIADTGQHDRGVLSGDAPALTTYITDFNDGALEIP